MTVDNPDIAAQGGSTITGGRSNLTDVQQSEVLLMYQDLLLNYAPEQDVSHTMDNLARKRAILAAAMYFRKLLGETSPLIGLIFELPLLVPALLKYLFDPCSNAVQLEAAWALVNITCGSTEEVKHLLSCTVDLPTPTASSEVAPPRRGCLLNIVYYLLQSQLVCPRGSANSIEALRDHLLWILGNLAADSVESRVALINSSGHAVAVSPSPADTFPKGGLVWILLRFVGIWGSELRMDPQSMTSLATMRSLVWIFNNLSRDLMTDPAHGSVLMAVGHGRSESALLSPEQVLGVCSLLSLVACSPDDELLLDW
jgi:hypothetical protein